jgi:hypothetical protein
MREKGQVDNWGQPIKRLDKKRLKQDVQRELEEGQEKRSTKRKARRSLSRSVAASVSEAIGKRIKEERSKQESSEKSEPSEKGIDSREKKPAQKDVRSPRERKERLGPKVNMKTPEVRGEKITSKDRLRELTNGEYSALKRKKDFPRRMHEAEVHQDLMDKYRGKERLKHGDIKKIAEELECDAQTVSNWLTKGDRPRLYTYMEWATPRSEASEKVRQILRANNGVESPRDVYQRFSNYYLGLEERAARFAKREEQKMLKYFEFLERYAGGGNHLDIAKEVGLSDSGARAYLDGATPRWVGLALQIPSETPPPGYKWLPLRYEHGGHGGKWSDWIEVPEKITSHKQVMHVIKQLTPLDNADMRRWDKLYSEDYTSEERFMHLLGAYVSDSSVPLSRTSAISFGMNLSKGYNWSKDFGDASCYHLGGIGIKAHRVSDAAANVSTIMTPSGEKKIIGKEQYRWMSENSTLLRWIRRSCLGYDDSAKTYQEVKADWIPSAPENLRGAFLQGYSDGDGGVSTKGYYFTISTHSDHDFVEKLLGSFGVETYRSRTYVRTAGIDAVRQLGTIPPFKYATDRQKALDKTIQMIESRRTSWISNPPSKNEIDFMKDLRQIGTSYGEIGEKLFDRFGYTLDPRDIWKILQTGNSKKKE